MKKEIVIELPNSIFYSDGGDLTKKITKTKYLYIYIYMNLNFFYF